MRLLHVVSTVDPSHGGVAESILRRGLRLVELGHDVQVASLDLPGLPFVREYPLPLHALGPGISHWCYAPALKPWLRANTTRFDAVVIDGLWQYHTVATHGVMRSAAVPYAIFPHGMLNQWSKQQHPWRHLRKQLLWSVAEHRVLRDAHAVLFTSEAELLEARTVFRPYAANAQVVPFGTTSPPVDLDACRSAFLSEWPALRDAPFLLFLGRLHPKKGCEMLLEAFAALATQAPNLHLVFAGPGEAEYVRELQALAGARGLATRTHWTGMLQGEVKWGCLAQCEAFVLPSHHENFGLAIVEAMAVRRPVLITDKINIAHDIAASGGGLVETDTVVGITNLLKRWLSLSPRAVAEMGERALRAFQQHYSIDAMALGLVEVFVDKSPPLSRP